MNVVSEKVFHGMQCPRGEKVLRSTQFGKCYVHRSVYYQMQSCPHCRALHVPTDPHLRASHDTNTAGTKAAGQELQS